MNKIVSIGAKVLAGVALAGSLVYYNFIDKAQINENARGVGEESFGLTIDTFFLENGQFKAGGEPFILSENRGKVVVLNFWANWCSPCKAEIPHFNEVYEEYSDEIEMVIVTTDVNQSTSAQTVADLYLNNGVNETEYVGWTEFSCTFGSFEPNNDILDLFLVVARSGEKKTPQALPVTVIIDRDGVIRYAGEGKLEKEDLIEQISPWL